VGINLIKLAPGRRGARPWRYLIYLDFEAGTDDPRSSRALGALSRYTSFVRVLGSYPAWREDEGYH
jgi:prephenate dehydratase